VSVQTEHPTFEKTYAEVQQFYARHIHLLDAGMVTEAALTFTEDASMLSPPKIAEPIRGRADLVAGLRKAANTLAEAGEVYRRCYTMISVEPQPGGELHVRSYVQVIATRVGGEARLHAMCVCEDVLVREDGQLKVRERCVTRDDVQ
jgi:SnoaL-like domain